MTDAVVIGAGHNGLVGANLLADQGWEVVVLEATPTPGGAVRSSELIEPGYVNDWCSAFYPMAAVSPTFHRLNLDDHGLRWAHAPLALAHPAQDGTCPVISRDPSVTEKSLEEHGPGDGDAWARMYQRWIDVEDGLIPALLGPMPPVRATVKLLPRLSPRDWVRLARFILLPVRRMGEEEFGSEPARRLLAGAALHADFAPESTLSGMFGWLMCALAQHVGFPVPVGGAQAITDSLVRRLESRGGAVRCDAPVHEVVVQHGRAVGARLAHGDEVRARRAVLADVNAPALYTSLVASDHLPASVLDDVARFHWDDPTFKVDWTLDGEVPWTATGARQAGTIHVSESVDHLTRRAGDLACGTVPAEPFLLVGQQGVADPSRQPAGKETAWAYTHVPRQVKADAGGSITGRWDQLESDEYADRVEGEIEKLAPGFRGLVRGRHITSPPGFEAENPNLVHGAINGGTSQVHQQLIFRPIPGLGRPGTPVPGLFLAGSSAHPGGAVHGTCGANAARAAVAADRLRRARSRISSQPSRSR